MSILPPIWLLTYRLGHPLCSKPQEGKTYFTPAATAFSPYLPEYVKQIIRFLFFRGQLYSDKADTRVSNLLQAAELLLRGESTQAEEAHDTEEAEGFQKVFKCYDLLLSETNS